MTCVTTTTFNRLQPLTPSLMNLSNTACQQHEGPHESPEVPHPDQKAKCHDKAVLPRLLGAPAEAAEASCNDNEVKSVVFNVMQMIVTCHLTLMMQILIHLSAAWERETHSPRQGRTTARKTGRESNAICDKQLGAFPNCGCHVHLNLGEKACHAKQPCSVPLNQVKAGRTEMRRQVNLEIVKRCHATKWGMPVLIVPKTDRSCRLVADFLESNEVAKPLHCPPPKL